MKTQKKLIQSCLLFVLLLPASVLANFNYLTVNGQITITGYSGIVTNPLAIPSIINGLPVTDISPDAFYFNTTLTNVLVPSSVTNIESDAFENCQNLLGITVNATNPTYASVGGVLFNKSLTALLGYPNGLAGPYTIPSTVTSIGDYAFDASGNLTAIAIPDTVTNIGVNAFLSCGGLTSVAIGSGVRNIGAGAFGVCSKLTSFTVNSTNAAYAAAGGVLFNKSLTTLVQYPEGLTGPYSIPGTVIRIGVAAFSGSKVAGVTIPYSVATIGSEAFGWCQSLTNVVIPNSVTNIDTLAFENCLNLAGVVLSTNVTSIPDDVFYDGFSLTGMTIPSSVTSIGDGSFYYCHSLTNIIFPGNLTNIGSAFAMCSSLTSVTIPGKVTSIGQAAFGNCANLTNITVAATNPAYASINGVLFNKSVTTLFQCPNGLAGDYTIPDGVTYIDDFAFSSCTKLVHITLPSSLATIGDNYIWGDAAFYGCTGLKGLYFLGNAPVLSQSDVFSGDPQAIVYYLAGTTGWSTTYGGLPTVRLAAPPANYNHITAQLVSGGRLRLSFAGNTNASYALDRTSSLKPPINWVPQLTNLTDASGMLVLTNSPVVTTNNFWRVRSVP